MEVLALLKDNTRTVHTIASSRSVEDAICLMADHNVRALLVTEDDQPAGIFCERDVHHTYLRTKSTAFSEIALENVMTRNLVVAEPQDAVPEVIARMVAANTMYLPVIAEKRIFGMLTLMDLMKHQIEALVDEIQQLNDYIDDLHDAGQY